MQDIRAIGFSANNYAFPEHITYTTDGDNAEPNIFKNLLDGMKQISEQIARETAAQQEALEDGGTLPHASFGSDYIDFRMAEQSAGKENDVRLAQIRSVKDGLTNAGYVGSGPFVSQTADTTDTDYVVGENGDIWIKNSAGESFLTSSGDDATLITRDAEGGITGMAETFSFYAQNGVYQFNMQGSSLSFTLQADRTGVSVYDSNGDLQASLNNDADVEKFGFLHELFFKGQISEDQLFTMFNSGLTLDQLRLRFRTAAESVTTDPLEIILGESGEHTTIQTTGNDGVVTAYDFVSGDFGIGGLGEGCTILHADGTITLGRSFEVALHEAYLRNSRPIEITDEIRNMIDNAVQFAQYVIGCADSADVAAIPGLVALLGQYSSALASIQPRVLEVDCAAATVGAACDKIYYKHGALQQVYNVTGNSESVVVGLSTEQLQNLIQGSDHEDFSPTASFTQQTYVA